MLLASNKPGKTDKQTRLISVIPESNILSCVIKDRQLNNTAYLPETLECHVYNNKDLTEFQEQKFDRVNFMNNKNRDFIIAELTPDVKINTSRIFGREVYLNPANPLNSKLYLDLYDLPSDNYYDFMLSRFNNWYFTPQMIDKHADTTLLTYLSDIPIKNGIVITGLVAANYFIAQFLEYLQISPAAKIGTIWILEYEKIIISFIDGGQEFLFYYNRY